MRAHALGAIVAVTAMGCAQSIPPPEAPEATLPEGMAQPESGQPGFGRIAIVTDVPARVDRLERAEGARTGGFITSLLCDETPCEVTLPYGDYEIRFTSTADSQRTSQALLDVHEGSIVLRHVLGQKHGASAIGPAIIVLGLGALVGAAITAVAVQSSPPNPSNGPSGASPDANDPAPYIALGGLGVVALGVLLTALPSSVHQDGATTQWSPSALPSTASGHVVGGSLALHF
jgi:hypothetical protein